MRAKIDICAHVQSNPSIFLNVLNWYKSLVGQHAQQTSQLARALAEELQLSEQETSLIGLAALVHDIGKIAITAFLLHKPGPLTEQEWVIMRCHSQIGAELLQSAGGICLDAAPLVLAHHERWDGHGYPHGMGKEAIPLGARILAIAEVVLQEISRRQDK